MSKRMPMRTAPMPPRIDIYFGLSDGGVMSATYKFCIHIVMAHIVMADGGVMSATCEFCVHA